MVSICLRCINQTVSIGLLTIVNDQVQEILEDGGCWSRRVGVDQEDGVFSRACIVVGLRSKRDGWLRNRLYTSLSAFYHLGNEMDGLAHGIESVAQIDRLVINDSHCNIRVETWDEVRHDLSFGEGCFRCCECRRAGGGASCALFETSIWDGGCSSRGHDGEQREKMHV